MMTSSNGNIFRVTGPLYGELTGPGEFPHKSQWRGVLMFSLICVWINGWVNNREAGDLRRHRGHYDVNVMRFVGHYLVVDFTHICEACFFSTETIILLPQSQLNMDEVNPRVNEWLSLTAFRR